MKSLHQYTVPWGRGAGWMRLMEHQVAIFHRLKSSSLRIGPCLLHRKARPVRLGRRLLCGMTLTDIKFGWSLFVMFDLKPNTGYRWFCQCESSPACCTTACCFFLILLWEKKLRNPKQGPRDSNGKRGPRDAGHMIRVTGLGPVLFTLRIIPLGLYHNGGLFVIYMRTAQKACGSIRRPPRTRVEPILVSRLQKTPHGMFVFVLTSVQNVADVTGF